MEGPGRHRRRSRLIIAAGFLLLSRPRLIADETSVRIRSFAGDFRTVDWDVVLDVEFPSNVRFARLVLPGDETLALYAVQRWDGDNAGCEAMSGVCAADLFARTHQES